jgi:hypothetical protein
MINPVVKPWYGTLFPELRGIISRKKNMKSKNVNSGLKSSSFSALKSSQII